MSNSTCIREAADQAQISRCRARIKNSLPQLTYLARFLQLAGNTSRLQILYSLLHEERLCVCDLSDVLGMKISAVSQHLRKLKDSGIVVNNKEGQTIYYSIAPLYAELLESLPLDSTQQLALEPNA